MSLRDRYMYRKLCTLCGAYGVHRTLNILKVRESQASSVKNVFYLFLLLIPYFLGLPSITPPVMKPVFLPLVYVIRFIRCFLSRPAVVLKLRVSGQLLFCKCIFLCLSPLRSFDISLHIHRCIIMYHLNPE